MRLEDDEVFASDMTAVGLQFHEPDAAPAPVTILPLVFQKNSLEELDGRTTARSLQTYIGM